MGRERHENALSGTGLNRAGPGAGTLDYKAISMPFPTHRMRRLRATDNLRALVREIRLDPPSSSSPIRLPRRRRPPRDQLHAGNYQLSVDELVKECAQAHRFASAASSSSASRKPRTKQPQEAYAEDGIVQRASPRAQARAPQACWSSPTSATASTPARTLRQDRRQRRG